MSTTVDAIELGLLEQGDVFYISNGNYDSHRIIVTGMTPLGRLEVTIVELDYRTGEPNTRRDVQRERVPYERAIKLVEDRFWRSTPTPR